MCFLLNFQFWWLVHWCEWGVKVSYYYCVTVNFSFCLLVFVVCIEVLLHWVHRYLQLLYLPLGLIPWSWCSVLLISCNLPYFKVYFVWYEHCYSSFLLLLICMEYIFPSSHFQSICVLGLKWVSCRQHRYWSCFCIHSASLCLLVGAFNPFTFKVIIYYFISPFNICCKASLVVLNSLKFCLSEKLLISPSVLNKILAGYSNLGCRFFPFSTLTISCHSLLACRVSAERSAVKLMGFPLYVTCCFSLAACNTFLHV